MKTWSTAAANALAAGNAVVSGAVKIVATSPARVWGGIGDVSLNDGGGAETYTGIGDRGVAQLSSGQAGSSELGASLKLSGVDGSIMPLITAAGVRGAPVVIWRLIYDSTAVNLLDAQVFLRGKVDLLTVDDIAGGEATITLAIEGAARGLGRRRGRIASDADQRLVSATDGGFKRISYAGQKMLYWGGKKGATAASALTNAALDPGSRLRASLNGIGF